MTSPFSKKCDRCGEDYHPNDVNLRTVLTVGYETLGEVEGRHIWKSLDLCPDCQRDLRLEFYQRGLMSC